MKTLLITATVVYMALCFSIDASAQHPCTATVEGGASDFTFTIPCAVVGPSADNIHDSIWLKVVLGNTSPFELTNFSGPSQNNPGANAAAPVPKTGCAYSTSSPTISPTRERAARAPVIEDPGVVVLEPVENHDRGDGDLRKGAPWPEPRFTDNGNGTVTDNLTGLIWLKDADCHTFFEGDATGQNGRPWDDALTAANSLGGGYCGLQDGSKAGDWRLPNVNELGSLRHMGVSYPALPNTDGTGKWTEGDPFSEVQMTYYWSSTTHAQTTESAWYMNFELGFGNYNAKTLPNHVWLVRGGQ